MGKTAVFVLKSDGFKGIEGETAERISRLLLYDGYRDTLDIFEIERGTPLKKGNLNRYKGYDVYIFIKGIVFITQEGIAALSRIAMNRREFSAVAPVSNESKVVNQRQAPPFIYQTISVFKWAVEEIYKREKEEVLEVDEIDDFCIAVRRELLDKVPAEYDVIDFPHVLKKSGLKFGIARGVYAHRYGTIYESSREDLMEYVPSAAHDILDIGCANGMFGEMLKNRQKCTVTGIDIDEEMAATARLRLDNVIYGDIEEILDKGILGNYDCIVCGDILEHLNDPWKIVRRLKYHLKRGGLFIASVPNANNWAVIYEITKGMWNYVPFSILSGAHIRFFTQQTFTELFERAGYEVKKVRLQSFDIPSQGAEFIKDLKKYIPEVNERELEASEIVLIAEG